MAKEKNILPIQLPRLDSQIQHAENQPEEAFIIPLDGQMITSVDPSLVGKNFSELINMRYANGRPETILGMEQTGEVFPGGMPETKVLSSLYYSKSNPKESHILAQVGHGENVTNVIDIKHAPISTETFTRLVWGDSEGAGSGIFSHAPNGQIAYCNGIDSCIWGGEETSCAAFIMLSNILSAPNDKPTSPRDYTDLITNSDTSPDKTVFFGASASSTISLLIHADEDDGATDIADSSINTHTLTVVGSAAVTNAQAKMGGGSLSVGTGSYVTIPDHASFDFGAGEFSIDLWLRCTTSGSMNGGIYGQSDGVGNSIELSYQKGIGKNVIVFKAISGGNIIAEYVFNVSSSPIQVNQWYHLYLGRSGSKIYASINGKMFPASMTLINKAIGSSAIPDIDAPVRIGSCLDVGEFVGQLDEIRVSKGTARWVANFTPSSAPYGFSNQRTYLLGSLRPASGAKIHILNGNTEASTVSVREFNGYGWDTRTILEDGTNKDGVTHAQTGWVRWGDTRETSVRKYIGGYFLYWYLVSVDYGSAAIYTVTLDVPFQNIVNTWDGTYKTIGTAYSSQNGAIKNDLAPKLYEYKYLNSEEATYVKLASTSTSWALEFGFTSKICALFIAIPEDKGSDKTGNITIEYWNGNEYVSVGPVSDGTSKDSKTLASTGIVSWNNVDLYEESRRSIDDSYPLYYYRVKWSATLGADTRIFYVAGIPIGEVISGYKFPIFGADRLMLCGNTHKKGNEVLISAQMQPDVFMGDDSYEIIIGGSEPLTGGAAAYTQYGSNLYNIIFLFKQTEMWALVWHQTSEEVTWSRFMLSPTIGCPAPLTVQSASVGFENNINQTKSICIWRGNDGIYMTSGQAPFCVSNDISDVFDRHSETHANIDMIQHERAFLDAHKQEYHWLWASNGSTVLDKEYVLDIQKWRWYTIERGEKKLLDSGCSVSDEMGNHHTYGFVGNSIMVLERGATFDGEPIVSTLGLSDQLLTEQSVFSEVAVQRMHLICNRKNIDKELSITHYIDGSSDGVEYFANMASDRKYATIVKNMHTREGMLHGFRLRTVSSYDTKGFQPLHIALHIQKVRDRTRESYFYDPNLEER